jgi:hypothetical protein
VGLTTVAYSNEVLSWLPQLDADLNLRELATQAGFLELALGLLSHAGWTWCRRHPVASQSRGWLNRIVKAARDEKLAKIKQAQSEAERGEVAAYRAQSVRTPTGR